MNTVIRTVVCPVKRFTNQRRLKFKRTRFFSMASLDSYPFWWHFNRTAEVLITSCVYQLFIYYLSTQFAFVSMSEILAVCVMQLLILLRCCRVTVFYYWVSTLTL